MEKVSNMVAVTMGIDGETFNLNVSAERKFNSGSKGYWANGHVRINGKDFNVSFPLVEVGSKPKKK